MTDRPWNWLFTDGTDEWGMPTRFVHPWISFFFYVILPQVIMWKIV